MSSVSKKLNHLQNIRVSNKMTYKNIADILNISKTYYWQIENGKRRLSYELAKKIANVFHLKPDDLFYEEL